MTARAPIRISLARLLNAIEDHCGFTHYYLDRETGNILFQSEHRCDDDLDGSPETNGPFPVEDPAERFLHIEPMDGKLGITMMADFIASLPEEAAASRLSAALTKRAPYRHFKDALRDHPDIEKQWSDEFRKRIETVAVEWLRYNTITFEFFS